MRLSGVFEVAQIVGSCRMTSTYLSTGGAGVVHITNSLKRGLMC